jgi:hypothetical protein
MLQELVQYVIDHPMILAAAGVFVALAVIGGWYVLSHHLHVIMVTLFCAAGFSSGLLVFYRGYQTEMRDLLAIGAFLIVVFPLIYQQAIRIAKIAFADEAPPIAKGHARRARA